MKDFKDYKRFPIIISPHDCLVIHVFERTDNMEDIWMDDVEGIHDEYYKMYGRAANQLIDQLQGCYCDLFLEELIKVCQNKLKRKD